MIATASAVQWEKKKAQWILSCAISSFSNSFCLQTLNCFQHCTGKRVCSLTFVSSTECRRLALRKWVAHNEWANREVFWRREMWLFAMPLMVVFKVEWITLLQNTFYCDLITCKEKKLLRATKGKWAFLKQGGWIRWSRAVPSNFNNFVILWI